MSGNGNDGTLKNDPQPAIGNIGQALNFDGSDDYVETPDINIVTGAPDDTYAISAWIKVKGSVDNNYAGIVESSRFNGLFACVDGGWSIQSSGDNAGTCASNTKIDDGDWHHVVGIYKESSKYLGYEDGEKVFEVSTSDSEGDNSEKGRIGDRVGGDDKFPGKIDNVRIYDRALSESEVKRLYSLGR